VCFYTTYDIRLILFVRSKIVAALKSYFSLKELNVEVHICNTSTQRLRQEDTEFKASLGYVARLCLKKKSEQVYKA
jgi:hypothetical protein